MRYYLQRLSLQLWRRWPILICTIYQVIVFTVLSVFIDQMESGVFKVYLLVYIAMSVPLLMMQYSTRSPSNSQHMVDLIIWIFAQVLIVILGV